MLVADILIDFVSEPLNKLKVFEYLLYHDVAEIYAGDAKFNNPEEMRHKQQREEAAHQQICAFHLQHPATLRLLSNMNQDALMRPGSPRQLTALMPAYAALTKKLKHARTGLRRSSYTIVTIHTYPVSPSLKRFLTNFSHD